MPHTSNTPARREHAIVIGGGIAGLLHAHVLGRHFERVTLIERDQVPDGPTPRAGAPQGHHIHVLLTHGYRVLTRYFPEFDELLDRHGAPRFDWTRDTAWFLAGDWIKNGESGTVSRLASRPLFEWAIREAVRARGNVRMISGHAVTGLRADPGHGGRVRGVETRAHGAGPHDPKTLDEATCTADLVVDASGRGSKVEDWLSALGYPCAPTIDVNAHLGYATRLFKIPEDHAADWTVLYVTGAPPDLPRAGALSPIEGGRWIVTLVGYNRDYPPTDETGFLEFANSLAAPNIYETIKHAEPLGPIRGYRRTANRTRKFESMPRWPAGFLCSGDAVCSLNPVYGQGMTNAARAAEVLDGFLADRKIKRSPLDARACANFQRRLAKANQIAFMLATADDFRWPETEGVPPRGLKLVHRYMDRVFRGTHRDADVTRRLISVVHFLLPPTALLHPRVLRGGKRERRR